MLTKIKILYYYLYYKYILKFKTRKELVSFQKRKLRKHLNFVKNNSSFYKNFKKYKDYPKTNKNIMMDNFNLINTAGITKEEAEDFAISAEKTRIFSPKLKGITVGLSSGTSGKRGIFLVSDKEKTKWAGYILSKFLDKGILSSYKIAFFMRANSNLYESVSSRNIKFHFFDIYKDINDNIKSLEKLNPDILVGQPSLLLMLAKEKDEGNLNIDVRKIISIAEVLEEKDKEKIKKSFNLEKIDEVYQCTEGCLATTCKCGRLHLNEDIVHIKKKYLDESRFIPIITDFERKTQPIIKYELNDILIKRKQKCECGSVLICIEKIEGRQDDTFIFLDENNNKKYIFPDFIRRCILFIDTKNDNLEYRVVQDKDNLVTVFANLTEEEKTLVIKEFQKLANDNNVLLPKLKFKEYETDKNKKLKRIERKVG